MEQKKQLNDREHAILSAIVYKYILDAEPVSSRALSKQTGLGLSPASIRNVMSDLEEKGYLKQPHTSAGRIPTDEGYRRYVDSLSHLEELSAQEKQSIKSSVAHVRDVDEVLSVTSQALGRVTHQLGLALSPRFVDGRFEKLDFISLSDRKVLLVLALQSGIVRSLVVEMESDLSPGKLATICAVLNERFAGLTVAEIQTSLSERMSGMYFDEKTMGVIRLFIPSIEHLFENTLQTHLHTSVMPVALHQPEFLDRSMLSAIMELVGDSKVLIHLLDRRKKENRVSITIGGENEDGQFKSFSIVTSDYRIGSMVGTLGVIGPTRMPYPKLISAVDYTARIVEENYKSEKPADRSAGHANN